MGVRTCIQCICVHVYKTSRHTNNLSCLSTEVCIVNQSYCFLIVVHEAVSISVPCGRSAQTNQGLNLLIPSQAPCPKQPSLQALSPLLERQSFSEHAKPAGEPKILKIERDLEIPPISRFSNLI